MILLILFAQGENDFPFSSFILREVIPRGDRIEFQRFYHLQIGLLQSHDSFNRPESPLFFLSS